MLASKCQWWISRASWATGFNLAITDSSTIVWPNYRRWVTHASISTLRINSRDASPGRAEYGLEMIQACGLGWKDFWMPQPDGKKPIQTKQRR